MWFLKSLHTNEHYYLYSGERLLVTRKKGYIQILGDESISREHAEITILFTESHLKNIKYLPEVRVIDLNSKFGTYVNEGIKNSQKIVPNLPVILKHNDTIKFGALQSLWRLEYKSELVTTSMFPSHAENYATFVHSLMALAIPLTREWSDGCTYVVMKDLLLTAKVGCALAAAKYIVTPDYFLELLNSVKTRSPFPDPKTYLPPLKEISINRSNVSFAPNLERQFVLKNKTLVFVSDNSLKKMQQLVICAGGTPVLLKEVVLPLLKSSDTLLIRPSDGFDKTGEKSYLLASALDILDSKKFYPIPESDIGLAVLYESTKKHCNPIFNVNSLLKCKSSLFNTSNVAIIAAETQDCNENTQSVMGTRVIPETASSTSSTKMDNCGMPPPSSIVSTSRACRMMENESLNCSSRLWKTYKKNIPTTTVQKEVEEECENVETHISESLDFKPEAASTQKYESSQNCIDEDRSQSYRADVSSTLLSRSNVNNSVYFESYTLPSLKMETFVNPNYDIVIKEEICSQNYDFQSTSNQDTLFFDENVDKKRLLEDNTLNWLETKRPKLDKNSNIQNNAKSNLIENSKQDAVFANSSRIKTEEDSIFNVPVTNTRRRHRICVEQDVLEPTSKKVRAGMSLNNNQNDLDIADKSNVDLTPTSKKGRADTSLNNSKNDFHSADKSNVSLTKGQNFSTSKPSVEQVHQPNLVNANNEIETVSNNLEKSLVIIEVTNLVKKKLQKISRAAFSTINFKKFKKTQHGIHSSAAVLPKIIGGNALVPHSELDNRREDWLAENVEIRQAHEEREVVQAEVTNGCSDFDLPLLNMTRSRNRRR